MNPFSEIMIAVGALVLIVSVYTSRHLHTIVPFSLRSKWVLLTSLICCFVIGYCGYLLPTLTAARPSPQPPLISAIFLGGSIFVYGVMSLVSHTLYALKDMQDHLQAQVEQRTQELNDLNQSLLESKNELSRQNRFLSTVIDAFPHPFYVIDAVSHEIILANKNARFTLSSTLNRTCYWLTHSLRQPCSNQDHPCPITEIRRSGAAVMVEHAHLDANKCTEIVEVHGSPIFDETGALTQIIEYCIDITSKKQTELALMEAKRLAETASRTKSEFLANMSHEIRTPMNAIMGMSYLTLQTGLDHRQRNYIEKINSSANHLVGIIDDILDISKMEAGQLQLSDIPFDLRQLVEGVISTLNVLASSKGLELSMSLPDDLPPAFIGDDMRLRQILLNLAGNAIKFTSAGSVSITVAWEGAEHAAGRLLHFTVADTGIGIAPEKLTLIFNTFEQTDSSFARRYGGSGLGLSICRQLVTLMEGKIWAESRPGSGSSFHFTVKLRPSRDLTEIKEPEAETEPEEKMQGLHILLVDDNELNLDVASMMLAQDHVVTTAGSGVEAMVAMSANTFDLIFMDVQMPEMDGLQATAIIRALERGESALPGLLPEDIHTTLERRLKGRHVPIVAMTAQAMDEDRQRCLDAGMDDYISKPFQYHHVVATIATLFQSPQQKAESRVAAPAGIDATVQVFQYIKTSTELADDQVARLMALARDNITGILADADKALQENDLTALGHQAHKLKGILLQCGFSTMAEKAQEIHAGIKEARDLAVRPMLEEIRKGINRFLEGL
jgi:signal transduction histidine kinase/CheY-like chemotaxis protein